MAQPWKPSTAIKLSMAPHGAAATALVLAPTAWPWALSAVAINQLIISGAGMLPRSTLLGPNITCLPAASGERREVALTIDDGPDPEITPRVLDLLDEADAKATFFCIGHRARRFPGLCREIIARGHAVENHGDSHSWLFAAFGMGRIRADITAAQTTLASITGRAPRFFRPTAGLRNPLLDPVLSELELQLAAWTRRSFDTRDGDPRRVHARLSERLAPRDIILLHDGNTALTREGEPIILAVLPQLLDSLRRNRLTTVTLGDAIT
jgi:peptidoglycan/xylan/chitin deacetylase (PgdA/CDA1 family)